MSVYLLDVNVLIALIDDAHMAHDAAHDWFARVGQHAWATCAITESGLLRIVGSPRYVNSPGSPATVAELLSRFKRLPGHRFWPDAPSLTDVDCIDTTRLLSHSQVTDTCLLATAVAHQGQLASFDRRLLVDAVRGGREALHLI